LQWTFENIGSSIVISRYIMVRKSRVETEAGAGERKMSVSKTILFNQCVIFESIKIWITYIHTHTHTHTLTFSYLLYSHFVIFLVYFADSYQNLLLYYVFFPIIILFYNTSIANSATETNLTPDGGRAYNRYYLKP